MILERIVSRSTCPRVLSPRRVDCCQVSCRYWNIDLGLDKGIAMFYKRSLVISRFTVIYFSISNIFLSFHYDSLVDLNERTVPIRPLFASHVAIDAGVRQTSTRSV